MLWEKSPWGRFLRNVPGNILYGFPQGNIPDNILKAILWFILGEFFPCRFSWQPARSLRPAAHFRRYWSSSVDKVICEFHGNHYSRLRAKKQHRRRQLAENYHYRGLSRV